MSQKTPALELEHLRLLRLLQARLIEKTLQDMGDRCLRPELVNLARVMLTGKGSVDPFNLIMGALATGLSANIYTLAGYRRNR